MRIVGLDLSLTATGVAVIDGDEITTTTIRSTGGKDDTIAQRVHRLGVLEHAIARAAFPLESETALVVVEGPSFGQQRQGGEHLRAGLWWRIVATATWHAGVAEVPPAALKRFATGKGTAGKDQVLLAAARRFPHVDVADNNQADALWLAAIGAQHLGVPVVDLPQAHLTVMDKIRWPEVPA